MSHCGFIKNNPPVNVLSSTHKLLGKSQQIPVPLVPL